jgi:hypothetical protein
MVVRPMRTKNVVGVVVRMPDELTADLDDHEVVAVELANHSRLPVPAKAASFSARLIDVT